MSKTDEQLIAEAVAAGKVKRIPMGVVSDWDSTPLWDRRRILFARAVQQGRVKAMDIPGYVVRKR